MLQLKNKIPELYHAFFPDFIEREVPEEKIATCNNCTMQMHPGSTNINTKCCIYYAQLPNYLIGGLLQDKRASLKDGQTVARRLINEKMGISPYGIRKPVWYKSFEKNTKLNKEIRMTQEDKETLRCPFYGADGNCTTWAYREHCCSTHFCFSVGGQAGQNFWKRLDLYLHRTERKLARYAAQELLGLGIGHLKGVRYLDLNKSNLNTDALNADNEQKIVDEEKYHQLWQGWQGSEEAFYIAAYELIQNLTPEQFLEITKSKDVRKPNQEEELNDLLTQFQKNILPEQLKWNVNTKIELVNEKQIRVSTDMGSHELFMTKLPLLQAFDGSRSLVQMAHLAFRADNNFAEDINQLLEIGVLEVKG